MNKPSQNILQFVSQERRKPGNLIQSGDTRSGEGRETEDWRMNRAALDNVCGKSSA